MNDATWFSFFETACPRKQAIQRLAFLVGNREPTRPRCFASRRFRSHVSCYLFFVLHRYCDGYPISVQLLQSPASSDCAFILEGCSVSSRYTFPYRAWLGVFCYLNYNIFPIILHHKKLIRAYIFFSKCDTVNLTFSSYIHSRSTVRRRRAYTRAQNPPHRLPLPSCNPDDTSQA